MDGSEITSFNIAKNIPNLTLKTAHENHFAITPQNQSPANEYRSADCYELLAKEVEQLNEFDKGDCSPDSERCQLVSQSSIEIEICDNDKKGDLDSIEEESDSNQEVNSIYIILFLKHSLNIYIFYKIFSGMDNFRCSLWLSALRYRLQYANL